MIGNDVIDLELAAAESDWRRKGFLGKLFSDGETDLILSSENPEISVWNLWSRKESAYKIFNRQTGIRSFNPLYFSCENLDADSEVVFGNSIVYSRTFADSGQIHTVCVADKRFFESILEVPKSGISKIADLPFYVSDGKKNPATASHHGRFEKYLALVGNGFDVDCSRQSAVNRAFLGNF